MKKLLSFTLMFIITFTLFNCSNEAVKEPVKGSIVRIDTIPPIEWNCFINTYRTECDLYRINIWNEFYFSQNLVILNSEKYQGSWINEDTFVTKDSTQEFKVIWPYIFRSSKDSEYKYFIEK